jgi:hypothetical protein
MGNLGVVFSDQVFQKNVYDNRFMAHLHAATYGGEYDAGVFYTHGEQPAHNLNLVSSTWAEVKVTKGMLSFAEAHQTKVSSKQSNLPNFIKSRKLCPVYFRTLSIA